MIPYDDDIEFEEEVQRLTNLLKDQFQSYATNMYRSSIAQEIDQLPHASFNETPYNILDKLMQNAQDNASASIPFWNRLNFPVDDPGFQLIGGIRTPEKLTAMKFEYFALERFEDEAVCFNIKHNDIDYEVRHFGITQIRTEILQYQADVEHQSYTPEILICDVLSLLTEEQCIRILNQKAFL